MENLHRENEPALTEREALEASRREAQLDARRRLGPVRKRLAEIDRMLHGASTGVGFHQAEAWAAELGELANLLDVAASELRGSVR